MAKRRKATCPECGMLLCVQVPAGGDGSADVFPRHSLPTAEQCPGSRWIVEDADYEDQCAST